MAVTKIWRIKGRADKVISYASNIEKTSFSESDRQALDDFFERRADFCFFAVVFHGYSYL